MSNLTHPAEHYARQLLALRLQQHNECVCLSVYRVALGFAYGDMTLDEAIDLIDECDRA